MKHYDATFLFSLRMQPANQGWPTCDPRGKYCGPQSPEMLQ